MTTLCMALFFRYLAKLCVENKTFKTNNSVENQHVSTNHFSNILICQLYKNDILLIQSAYMQFLSSITEPKSKALLINLLQYLKYNLVK